MSVFIEHPLLAAVLGALYLAAFWVSRRPVVLVAAVAWLGYTAYEMAMHLRWRCTGECNIRLDLLLIYPILLVLSVAAVVAALRWQGKHRQA